MEEYDSTGLDLVRVSGRSGRVAIVAEERSDVSVSQGRVQRRGATLTVTTRSTSTEVRVPAGTSVVAGTRSGAVSVSGPTGAVSIATVSGAVSLREATSADVRSRSGGVDVGVCAKGCRVRTKSGQVRVGETTDLDVHTASGRVEVGEAVGDIHVMTTHGRIEIGLGGPSEVLAETVSGRIGVSLGRGLGARVDAGSNARHVKNTAPAGDECSIVVRTATGRISVSGPKDGNSG